MEAEQQWQPDTEALNTILELLSSNIGSLEEQKERQNNLNEWSQDPIFN